MKKLFGKTFILLLGAFIGYYFGAHSNSGSANVVVTGGNHVGLVRSIDMDLFWDVWEIVDEEYPFTDEVNDKEDRVEGAIRGMLQSLDDPYTQFMNYDESKSFDENLEGKLYGIGAEVTMKNALITVVAPLKNSPSAKIGVRAGDIIVSIDGDSTVNMTLGEAVKKMRGELGTKVSLEVFRRGEQELLKFDITRGEIHFDSVNYKMLDGKIAYIEIVQFDDNTHRKFNAAVNDLLLDSPKALILDVRNNSGGFLETSIDVLGEFTDSQRTAVLIKKKNARDNEVLKTSGKARLSDIPLVVLVNEGSASASEIVAGAIKDWERGKLIGMKTFGKGSVQELKPLKSGNTLRLTIAKWNTPNDVNINKEGISPDIEVDLTGDDHDNDRDPQLDCAVEFLTKGSICEVSRAQKKISVLK